MKPVIGSVSAGAVAPAFVDSGEAYATILEELQRQPDEELAPVNLDIMFAVATALGRIAGLKRFRTELASLPGFDIERFDKLETYALAAGHAHALHVRATSSPDVTALVEAATGLREILLADATALGRRGLIGTRSLTTLKGPLGYRNLAFDLSALSSALSEAWPRLEGKTAITMGELSEARLLCDRLLSAVSLRERASSSASATAMARQRAFTLFTRAYDQTRRAFTYLRWEHGDVDELVPSLYDRRAARRKNAEAEPDTDAASSAAQALGDGATQAPLQNGRLRERVRP
jgi:hypothetical protein